MKNLHQPYASRRATAGVTIKEFEQAQAARPSDAADVRALTILERSVYRGPHLFSNGPMIRIQADLGTLEEWPSDRLPLFTDHLLALLPGLGAHGCSYGAPGGLVRRLQSGTWLGHVIEHVALELQCLAGSRVTRGKTRSVRGHPGVYNILYAYQDEETGVATGAFAIALVLSLVPEGLRRIEGARRLGSELPATRRTSAQ